MKHKNIQEELKVVFIDKNRLELFSKDLTSIVTMEITPDLIKDMEVINKDDLKAKIVSFINQNKIPPSNLVLVLSDNLCFTHEVPEAAFNNNNEVFAQYLEYIPFENVNHKIYRTADGYKVVAVNTDLFETVREAFAKMGFTVTAVVPTSAIGINIKNLDLATGRFLIEKSDFIKQQTIVLPPRIHTTVKTTEIKVMGVPRIFLLLGVLFLMMVLLLYLAYSQTQAVSKKNPKNYPALITPSRQRK